MAGWSRRRCRSSSSRTSSAAIAPTRPQNEGLGKVAALRGLQPEVIERLRWMAGTLYPALQSAIEKLGSLDLKTIIAQALHMGDEVHNRNRAATSLLYRALARRSSRWPARRPPSRC